MITLIFNNDSMMPLYEQLYKFIRSEIENDRLHSHEKMPSKRKLSSHLKVSTVTIETAYSQLAAEGYLVAVPRSGYYVQVFDNSLLNNGRSLDQTSMLQDKEQESCEFDFKTNVVDTKFFPFATWTKLAREVLSESSNELLNVTHPQGSYKLRQDITDYLYNYRGIKAMPEQIIVGAGSEYLMGLIIQILGRKNIYAVENPGYNKIYKILKSNDVITVPVSIDDDGLSEKSLRETNANIVHITPSHQFPLGTIMPVSRRMSLLKWANERDDRYIIEDDYDSEFRFTGYPIPALQGLDHAGKIIYINAFTKSIAPSLRISYVVLPHKLIEIYKSSFMFYSCTVPNFEQYTLSKFMSRGYFERHLSRMRNIYKKRRDLLIDSVMRSQLRGRVEIIGHDAGLHLLMHIKNGLDEETLVAKAKAVGVRVYGLSEYYSFPALDIPQSTLVIGYSGFNSDDIEVAVERLENAWAKKLTNPASS